MAEIAEIHIQVIDINAIGYPWFTINLLQVIQQVNHGNTPGRLPQARLARLAARRLPSKRPAPQMCMLYVYSCRYYFCTTNILHMYYMSTTYIYIYILHICTYIHIFILTCVLPIPVIWHSDHMLPMPLPCPSGFTWDFGARRMGDRSTVAMAGWKFCHMGIIWVRVGYSSWARTV